MTPHDWYVDNRLAFATRMLEGKEESLFANHLSRCEECRTAVAQLEQDLTWLPMGAAPLPLRPGLTHDLMQGVLRRGRTRWWQWTPALAAAAALVVALAVWTETRREIGGLRSALEARQGRLRATEDSLSAILGAERVLQETVRGPGYKGGFLLFYDQDTERWNVVVHDLPPARAGEEYRLWFVTDRGLLPGPELRANGQRPTFLTLPAAGPSGDFVGAVLTVGPAGERTGRPRIELARLTF
ncbi:MAG TPA: anti-sigma factor [Gemmatimonadales bacterium]|nr:anti-sigma factor [Gemmatimonadales bacterium]